MYWFHCFPRDVCSYLSNPSVFLLLICFSCTLGLLLSCHLGISLQNHSWSYLYFYSLLDPFLMNLIFLSFGLFLLFGGTYCLTSFQEWANLKEKKKGSFLYLVCSLNGYRILMWKSLLIKILKSLLLLSPSFQCHC